MKKGFTLIEILIIVAIIGILATAILVSMQQSKKNARINGVKTSLRTVLPAIISCKDGGGTVNVPIPSVVDKDVCNPVSTFAAKWPALSYGYSYGDGVYNSADCKFKINTGDDDPLEITCDCLTQICK